jgi:hypothetical protein
MRLLGAWAHGRSRARAATAGIANPLVVGGDHTLLAGERSGTGGEAFSGVVVARAGTRTRNTWAFQRRVTRLVRRRGGIDPATPGGQHAVIVTTRLLCKPSKLNAHKTPDRAKARTAWERDWKLR